MLIGSNAIQIVALRNDFTRFSRKADAKIALLREVIERIQKGEDVDVEGLLGTGDQEQEKEWEEGKIPYQWFYLLLLTHFPSLARGRRGRRCLARESYEEERKGSEHGGGWIQNGRWLDDYFKGNGRFEGSRSETSVGCF